MHNPHYTAYLPDAHAHRKKKGFSVIEMLVVTALLGIISTIVTQILVISVRSTLKAEIQKEVKQNGDYAMSEIERGVRNAVDVSVTGCDSGSCRLTVTNPNATTTVFTCDSSKKITSSLGDLTNSKVAWSVCTFQVVSPVPPVRPKYVYVHFTLTQAGSGADLNSSANLPYQSTIELRSD